MNGDSGNDGGGFRENLPPLLALILGLAGFIVLVWLSIEDPDRRDSLAEAADWLMKGGIGAFFGTLAGRRVK